MLRGRNKRSCYGSGGIVEKEGEEWGRRGERRED